MDAKDAKQRALAGALGGLGGTFVLVGLRKGLAGLGVVDTTAPEQVVRRLGELGFLKDRSPGAREALAWGAHFGYGVGAGAAFGLLRAERGDPASSTIHEIRGADAGVVSEAAVGAALGVLSWGAGWAGWLPLAGVHPAPWTQRTPKVLLPILDHAAFGAAWGLIYRALTRRAEASRT